MSIQPVSVFVIDGSSVYRRLARSAVEELSEATFVGAASDGRLALEKLRSLKPDLIVLDADLARSDGGGILQTALDASRPPRILILSETEPDEDLIRLVESRPHDLAVARKPHRSDPATDRATLKNVLQEEIDACRARGDGSESRSPKSPASRKLVLSKRRPLRRFDRRRPEAVCIGVSTGGPEALRVLLPRLPADFPLPVLIVQHMPAGFTRSLAHDLDRQCALRVCEASEGQEVARGNIYIAPGGRQMKVTRSQQGVAIQITDDLPEHNCRPAVDYLFRSAADAFDGAVVGVILTGMGTDGANGCQLLKDRGATIVCQEAKSCVVYGMPRAAIERGLADRVADLHDLAATLEEIVAERTASC
jgi:two-component system chemotaxis response regulator CheB